MERYDIITVGRELPGLITSALLAKRGKKVLLIDNDKRRDKYLFKKGNYTFVKEPSLFFGFEKGGVFDQLFSELGITLFLLRREGYNIGYPSPLFQVVLSDNRIDIFSSREEFLHELKREFLDEIDNISSFLNEIYQIDDNIYPFVYIPSNKTFSHLRERISYLKDRLRYILSHLKYSKISGNEYLLQHNLDGRFKEFSEMLNLFFYLSAADKVSAVEIISLFGFLKRGAVSIRGGIPTLSDILIENIKKNGGSIIPDTNRLRFAHKKRSLQGIYIKEDTMIRGDRFIFNISKDPFHNRSRRSYRFYFIINDNLIPSPMKENLILAIIYDKDMFADKFIYINLSPENDRYFAPPGKRCIKISCILSDGMIKKQADMKERVVNILLRHLTWLMPFSDDGIDFIGDDMTPPTGRGHLSEIINDSPEIVKKRNVSLLYTRQFKMIEPPNEAVAAYALADKIIKRKRIGELSV
ncbi:MAG: hypothetical protein ACE5EA_02395 [Nitrospirota bacterium]